MKTSLTKEERQLKSAVFLSMLYVIPLYIGFAWILDVLSKKYEWWCIESDMDFYRFLVIFMISPLIAFGFAMLTVKLKTSKGTSDD